MLGKFLFGIEFLRAHPYANLGIQDITYYSELEVEFDSVVGQLCEDDLAFLGSTDVTLVGRDRNGLRFELQAFEFDVMALCIDFFLEEVLYIRR